MKRKSIYYHGTTVMEARAIMEQKKFTQGTLLKDKDMARKYAERNTRLNMGFGGALLEIETDEDYGEAIDVGKRYGNDIEIKIKKIKVWKV